MPPDFARLRLHDAQASDPNTGAEGHPDGGSRLPSTPTSNPTPLTHKHTLAHSREHPPRNTHIDTDISKEGKRARDGTVVKETRSETAIQRETHRTKRMEAPTDRRTDRKTNRQTDPPTQPEMRHGARWRGKTRKREGEGVRGPER